MRPLTTKRAAEILAHAEREKYTLMQRRVVALWVLFAAVLYHCL